MKFIDKLTSVIAPHNCIVCRAEGAIVCDSCYLSEFVPKISSCFLCSKATNNFSTCTDCQRKTPIKQLYVATYLDEYPKEIVYKLKFDRLYSAGERIAQILRENSPTMNKDTIITYVPTSPDRIRKRGYDHAKLIASNFAQMYGLPCSAFLTKTNATRQVGANKKQRSEQANNSYALIKRDVDPKRKIILIDDITTTGATLGACVKIMKKAGYKNVTCLVFASKL